MKHLVLLIIVTAVVTTSAQRKTIPEEVRAKQGPVRRVTMPLIPPLDVQTQVNEATIIVHARVTTGTARLTADEQWVVTRFTLSPIEILLDTRPPSPIPVPPPSYEATFLGGQVTVDGFAASAADATFPPPNVDDELVVILERDDDLNSWTLVAGAFSVYKVTPARTVESIGANAPYHGRPLNDLLADIRKYVAAR